VDNKSNIRLPNAPLVEVVFELRWMLQGGGATPWFVDPGFLQTRESFTKNVTRLGFTETREMPGVQEFIAGYAIARRFYLAKDREFPLMQIGPGIFATNQSAEYDWSSFKKQVLDGIRTVLISYPSLPNFPLTPNYLELRYVDAFDGSLVGTTDLVQFLNAATSMKIDIPPFFDSKAIFAEGLQGRVQLHRLPKDWKASQFSFGIGSGRRGEEAILSLETKVVTTAEGVPKLRKSSQGFLSGVTKWLEFAHGITSPFFKDFVKAPVMQRFQKADK
jgi:uncharacterized protein (TIGR04255 family)